MYHAKFINKSRMVNRRGEKGFRKKCRRQIFLKLKHAWKRAHSAMVRSEMKIPDLFRSTWCVPLTLLQNLYGEKQWSLSRGLAPSLWAEPFPELAGSPAARPASAQRLQRGAEPPVLTSVRGYDIPVSLVKSGHSQELSMRWKGET